MPSVEFRMHAANLLVKVEDYKKSVKILDSIIQEEDEHLEAWFLLASNLCHLKKYDSSKECLKNIDLLMEKYKVKEPELNKAVEDIKRKVQKGLTNKNTSSNNNQQANNINANAAASDQAMNEVDEQQVGEDDEGFETYSEEDVSDDEEEGEGSGNG